ncbi:MAG: aminotransferase class I/II-fold pyridoxal phosphate-dependent enzyme [Candidatus Bathyarchaeota archaeon]|nr:aminotransferase class I/II-fold pyridoxal phosphate-dependent enzyme [Candidatus Bathyarchaeota archaeon]
MQVKPSNLLQNFRHYEVPFLRRIAELERGGKEIISFTGGDAALLGYEPPAYTTTALVNAAKKNLTMYPSFSRDLIKRFREAVARREKKVHGTSYDPEDVIWTNGVTHAHNLVYFSLLGPENECILLEPTHFSWCARELKMLEFKKKFTDYVNFCVLMPMTTIAAATEVLERSLDMGGMNHLDTLNKKLERQRDFLWKRMNEIEGVSCVKPRGTYYTFPLIEEVGKTWKSEGKFVMDLLEEGVYVRPGFLFGSVNCQRHVRVSFILSIDEMRRGLDVWETFMKKQVG